MNEKKYYFLAGLPRSGNTLLSSILNQNPEISVSANSCVGDLLLDGEGRKHCPEFINFPDHKSLDDYIGSIFDSYYQNWPAKYIIDRGVWGMQNKIHLLEKHLKNEIKIIVTVRDYVEILASFLKANPSIIRHAYEAQIAQGIRHRETYKTEIEVVCEVLSSPNSLLERTMNSLANLLQKENRKYLHIIEYNDLVGNPKETIDGIYKFLNIPKFNHKFEDISQFKSNGVCYNDNIMECDLHSVKKELKKSDYEVKDFMTEDLILKYSGREFWRK
jgi:hypothetical protein